MQKYNWLKIHKNNNDQIALLEYNGWMVMQKGED